MTNVLSIYNYTDISAFLLDYCDLMRQNRKRYWSLGLWSQKLELSGPAVLTNVISGRRCPGKELQQKLVQYFDFDTKEQEYLENLVYLKRLKSKTDLKQSLLDRLNRLSDKQGLKLLDQATLNTVSNWYYIVLREMVSLPYFTEDAKQLAKMFRGQVTARNVQKALDDMEMIGLLVRDKTDRLVKADKMIKSSTDIPSEDLKKFHEMMINLGLQSIRSVSIDKRDITGITFNISDNRIQEAKKHIAEFRAKMCDLFEENQLNAKTYQLNVQLFPLIDEAYHG